MTPFITQCQPRLLLSSRQLPFKSLQSPCIHEHHSLRGLVTFSAPPPINVAVERPETVVLVESSLYRQQWKEPCASFFTSQGLHFSSLDITTSLHDADDDTSLASMEQTLSADLDQLSSSAHTILIARGPIQSLVAQYYLESLPLAGLVLIDPLIFPKDGRNINDLSHGGDEKWSESVNYLLEILDDLLMQGKTTSSTQQVLLLESPLDIPKVSMDKSSLSELNLLQSLPRSSSRPLYLEPSSVPILIMYSGHHVYQEYYKKCAERTAKFHSGHDYISLDNQVLEIPGRMDDSGVLESDCEWAMKRIFEWYDGHVA